jgi:hypothetical protein
MSSLLSLRHAFQVQFESLSQKSAAQFFAGVLCRRAALNPARFRRVLCEARYWKDNEVLWRTDALTVATSMLSKSARAGSFDGAEICFHVVSDELHADGHNWH